MKPLSQFISARPVIAKTRSIVALLLICLAFSQHGEELSRRRTGRMQLHDGGGSKTHFLVSPPALPTRQLAVFAFQEHSTGSFNTVWVPGPLVLDSRRMKIRPLALPRFCSTLPAAIQQ